MHFTRMIAFPTISRCFAVVALAVTGNVIAQVPPEAAEDIRGPKPLIEIPVPQKPPYEIWLAIGGGLLLLILAWFVWRHFKAKQRAKSPREVALSSLGELEKIRESLAAEAFANRAAQTVRQYIAERFGIAAPRRTTEEFLRDLTRDNNSPLTHEGDHLKAFLKSCDLAKFAGSKLDDSQRGELVEAARNFIRATSHAAPQ